MKKNIMSMNRTQSLNNVPSDAARRQQTHQQTQSPMIHQDYQIRDSNKNSSSNDRRRRRLSSSDNIRLSASERLRIRCGDGLFHPPTTTTTAASDKLTTTDGGRSHSNNLSKKQSKIELLGSRSNSNNKSAKLFKIMSNTNCISNDECVVAELGLSDRGDDNYEGDVAVAADKSSSNNGDELLIMASSSNTQNNHHSPHSSSNPASSRRRKRVVNARRSLSLNDAYYYDVDYFNDLDFAYDNDDGGNSDDGDGRVKEGIVEEESIEGTCSENDGEVDEKSGRMAQCERVAVNDEEGKQQQHCRVGATVRDGVRVGRDDNKRRGVKEEEEQQGGGGIVARIARQRATSTFTNNKQSVNEQQRQQQQQPKNDGSELLLDRSVSTTGSDVVAADVAAAATRSSTPPLKSHRRSLSFDDAHHYNNFGGLDDDLHSDSSLSMIGDGEFKDVTSGPTTSTSPPQHHTNSLTSSLEVVVGGPRVPSKKRKDDEAAAPRSTKQQEGDEVDEDDAKMGKQQQTTLRLDAPNNKNNRERKLSVPSTAATSRTSDFTVPLADGEVDHDDEDDDESYSDVERMYDILTTNEAQQQKRREEQQQQQRRQERQMHQLDTSTLSHDTLLTHNRHSFMEDYIQLKMQNAELRSELQHSQAETSRLNSEVLNVQKENAELRMQNELLLASGGGREGTLKKENEFMKQILYNLERLGKIDNVDEILKSRSEDLGEEMDVVRRSNSAAATVGGNRRLFLRKRDSSRSKNKWGDELDWGSSCASVTNAPPPPVPQQRHRSMFRRFSAPFSSSKDNLMEVQELPITKSDECILPPKDNSQPSRMRRRSRSFSHHSLTSLFRWSQDEEQEISSVGATRSNLQQGDSEKSRSNSIGDAIKGISRSLSSKNLRGSISSTAKADANEPKTVQDDKDNSIPKVVHTNRGFDWMKCSDLSQDVVPSSQIPTLGGTSDSLPVGNDLNFNVDIREAARQASESYYRPTRNRGMRDKRLFGSSLMSSNSSGGFQN